MPRSRDAPRRKRLTLQAVKSVGAIGHINMPALFHRSDSRRRIKKKETFATLPPSSPYYRRLSLSLSLYIGSIKQNDYRELVLIFQQSPDI